MKRRTALRILAGVGLAAIGAWLFSRRSRLVTPLGEEQGLRKVAQVLFGASAYELGAAFLLAEWRAGQRKFLGELVRDAREHADGPRVPKRGSAGEAVREILRSFYTRERIWKIAGYPHGYGVCTEFDAYTKPPR